MHWAHIQEAGFLGGMRFLLWINHRCGRTPFRAALAVVMLWFFTLRPLARRASFDYLARLHAASDGATPAPTLANSFRHFLAFGESLLEKILAWDASAPPAQFPFHAEGEEHFRRLLKAGQGGVIVTAHFGNLELCRRLARDHVRQLSLTLLVHTRHARHFNALLAALNPEQAIELIQVDSIDAKVAMRLSERVAAGGFVVIAGDRVPLPPADNTLSSLFLGERAAFPLGPYLLAAALACPVLAMFNAHDRHGFSFTVHLLAERLALPRQNRRQAAQPCLDRYVAALEAECKKHPLQWFNFFPFWQQNQAETGNERR